MKIAIVYWSGTGNTEAMAEAMAEGANKAGAEATLFQVGEFSKDSIDSYDGILFGCPAMGNEVLEESEFEPFFTWVEDKLADKPVGLFGSYGWGDGEWLRDWQERCQQAKAKVYGEGLMINNVPDDEGLKECQEFAGGFVEENK